ncbi:transporter substrate-binding domain-containing protein [Streptomyces natalensis]|uniref:transporter substrate-binding domain-containing protein n=1 Tax=Streptomyces natalensis TaxID=68242 RepID=UPI00068D9470|nr:transporter substrate-binding domain-containing protein [Streptomyces natalensis]
MTVRTTRTTRAVKTVRTTRTVRPRITTGTAGPGRPALAAGALLALLALSATACGADQPPSLFADGTVQVGTKNDQPGTAVVRNYKFSGFDTAVARQVLKAVDAKPDFGIVPSEDRRAVLTDKTKDLVVATYSITVDRMKDLDFVGPYATTYEGLMVRKRDNRIKKPDDVNGKRVCTWPGTTAANTLESPRYNRIQVYEAPDASTCINDLKVKKTADAVSIDQMILYGFTQENPDLKVVPDITYGSANQYGIAMAKGHRQDCLKLRDALRNYLGDNAWSQDFATSLPSIPKADATWETDFKPRLETVDSLSCRDRPGT